MKTKSENVLSEKKMADGRTLRVLRYVSPGDEVPERVVRYVIASLGFDSYNEYIQTQAYWRSWYRESFEGRLGGVASHLYLAEVDGVLAARVWFAYARQGGFGNFGNVYTETAYRRLGLLGELLAPAMADFDAAPDARILCCWGATPVAVRAYLKRGFRLTYGGEIGFLERTRRPGEDFFSIEREVFADARLASIRPGAPADQFVTDKFIAHTEPVVRRLGARRGPAAAVPEFRVARIEAEIGNGVVNVACNAAGTVTGHCFALASGGAGLLDFTAHAASFPDVPELIRATAEAFHRDRDMELLFHAFPEDAEKIAAVKAAGGRCIGATSRVEIYSL